MRTHRWLPLLVLFAVPARGEDPTFAKDVAPILFKHCGECHRPGEVAPFSLLSYKDAQKRAKHIKQVVVARTMPPWHAAPGPVKFQDEKRLTDDEIRIVSAWADAGAPEGDPKLTPPEPTFSQGADGWHLGKPDLVLKITKPFDVPADGPDIHRLYALAIPYDKVKYLRGLEFRPGNRRVVHHANLYVDSTGSMRQRVKEGADAKTFGLGFEQAGVESLQGLIGAWVPGTTARFLPDGVTQLLPPGTDLIVGIHYHPNGKAETDESSVALYFSDTPGHTYTITWPVAVCPLFKNTHLLDIAAGKKEHTIRLSSSPLPADAKAYGVYTHGHYLMKDVLVTAKFPDGKSLDLVQVKDWDFNWQDRYFFQSQVPMPRGSRIDVVATFDNSDGNPQNPHHPPKDVKFGSKTDDEMFSAIVLLLPEKTPKIPPGGLAIPEWAANIRKKFDKNADGKMTEEELANAPGMARLMFSELADAAANGRTFEPPGGVPALPGLPSDSPIKLPPEGWPLPEQARMIREQFDKNKDGKLTQNEFDAIPDSIRTQVERLIRAKMGNGPVAKAPVDAPKPKEEGFKLPAEGVPIPEAAKVLRERFDKNKDGKLTQDEFDAMPPAMKSQAETIFKERLKTPAKPPSNVTFTRDVAPILFKHCAECHREGQVAPFPLLTYADAAKRADFIKEITASKRMPPWHADGGKHKFLDERRLTDDELRTLAAWADTGAKEGDAKDLPPAPTFNDGWRLGKPDMIVTMTKPFTVPAGGKDIYRAFVVPLNNTEVKWVRAIEFHPKNRRVIHHCNFFLDSTGKMRERAQKEGDGSSFPIQNLAAELLGLQGSAGEIGGWAPGTTPRFLPEDIARPVKPGSDLVMHVHFHPSGKEEEDQSSVGLYFSPTPPTKSMLGIPLLVSPAMRNAELLNIPAGKKDHTVQLSVTVPADVKAYAIQPHAHYLLKTIKVTATPPGGAPETLISINDWDMNWQDRYYYAEPVPIAKGSKLDMVAVFDNSATNPQNPTSPPKDVKWGLNSSDEMLNTFVFVMGTSPEASAALRDAFGRKGSSPKAADTPATPLKMPAGGFPIPAAASMLRDKYDANKDGKLSQEEYDALPEFVKNQVTKTLRDRFGEQFAAPASKDAPKDAPFRIPPGGAALPEAAKLLREKYDINKDGKLSQEEFDAIPAEIKSQVERMLQQKLGGTPAPKAPAPAPMPKDAAPAPFRLPAEGLPIPEAAKVIREKFDTNKDGKLTQDEFDAMPAPIKEQAKQLLKDRVMSIESKQPLAPVSVPVREVTFAKDVAPILFKHCAACHREGEVAPFSLLTYADAAKRASHIKEVTARRQMPPWHAEPGELKFLDERRLTDAELRTLADWADSGAKQGNPAELPPIPELPKGWRLGKPDIVLSMPQPFEVPTEGTDIFLTHVIRIPGDKLQWVRGIEFQPGNRRVVHHATIMMDPTGRMKKWMEENDPSHLGFSGAFVRDSLPARTFPAFMGAWTPGSTARFLPDGVAQPIEPGTDLVIQLHYHPTGKPETDHSSVGLYLSQSAGKAFIPQVPLRVSTSSRNTELLNIPAGTKRHAVTLTRQLPDTARAFAVQVHGHYLLREAKFTATLPDKSTLTLIDIKNWDFNWQDSYVFANPPLLPKGTTLTMEAVYDNSAENPQNPSKPPKEVKWGSKSTDEMLGVLLAVLPEGEEASKTYAGLMSQQGKSTEPRLEPTDDQFRVPPEGLQIPANARIVHERYDANKDGKLSQKEFDAMPEDLKKRIEQGVRGNRTRAGASKVD